MKELRILKDNELVEMVVVTVCSKYGKCRFTYEFIDNYIIDLDGFVDSESINKEIISNVFERYEEDYYILKIEKFFVYDYHGKVETYGKVIFEEK